MHVVYNIHIAIYLKTGLGLFLTDSIAGPSKNSLIYTTIRDLIEKFKTLAVLLAWD